MKTLKITLFILITQIPVQTVFAQEIDNLQINTIYEKALAFQIAKQPDSAVMFYNQAIELCQVKNSTGFENKEWATEKYLTCLTIISIK